MQVQVCMLHRFFDVSVHICMHTRCRMCTCAHVCAVSVLIGVGGQWWGGSASLSRALVAWRGGLFLTDGEIGVLSMSSIFCLTRVGLYVDVHVCIRTQCHALAYTHTARGVLDVVSPGVGTRHMEGPKNPDGLRINFGICVIVHLYKVDKCIYMLGSEMSSCTNCFVSLTFFSFRSSQAS